MSTHSDERIYFYCCPPIDVAERAVFQHVSICLAEGFKQLGIEFYSNVNYWQTSPDGEDYLSRHDPKIKPDDCSIVCIENAWFDYGNSFPENLFRGDRTYTTVLIDGEDNSNSLAFQPGFEAFDLILRTHFNSKFRYPANVYPWAFGLSQRILKELSDPLEYGKRKKNILFNFRSNHPVRRISARQVIPRIQPFFQLDDSVDTFSYPSSDSYQNLMWTQTNSRHYLSYYKRLQASAACACFGGSFMSPFPQDPSSIFNRSFRRMIDQFNLKTRLVSQWDSWRLWESMAAGCVTFHVDLEKYGCLLPVMPKNWQHYIGVDFDHIQDTIERIERNPELLENIAVQGRAWALKYYSPVPTALRFLETVNQVRCFSQKHLKEGQTP